MLVDIRARFTSGGSPTVTNCEPDCRTLHCRTLHSGARSCYKELLYYIIQSCCWGMCRGRQRAKQNQKESWRVRGAPSPPTRRLGSPRGLRGGARRGWVARPPTPPLFPFPLSPHTHTHLSSIQLNSKAGEAEGAGREIIRSVQPKLYKSINISFSVSTNVRGALL